MGVCSSRPNHHELIHGDLSGPPGCPYSPVVCPCIRLQEVHREADRDQWKQYGEHVRDLQNHQLLSCIQLPKDEGLVFCGSGQQVPEQWSDLQDQMRRSCLTFEREWMKQTFPDIYIITVEAASLPRDN